MNLGPGISEQFSIKFASKCADNFTQAQRHAAPYQKIYRTLPAFKALITLSVMSCLELT